MSSPGVQVAATLAHYVPAVHETGNGAHLPQQGHHNGVANAADDGLVAQQARLQAEIGVAKERIAAAKARIAEHDAEGRAALRAALEQTREQLAEIERVHRESVVVVQDAARREVDQILADARAQAEAMREGGGCVGERAGSDGS